MNIKKLIIAAIAVIAVTAAGIAIYNSVSSNKDDNEQITNDVNNIESEDEKKDDKKDEDNSANPQNGKTENKDNTKDKASEKKEPDNSKSNNSENKKVYTPTFMYFVSKSDDGYEKTMDMIEELKKEYDGKVVFDIKNVDDEPELKDNFPVDGKTPALIMLDINNDISAFEFMCSDKGKLKECIDGSFNPETK